MKQTNVAIHFKKIAYILIGSASNLDVHHLLFAPTRLAFE
jgi:hypothetical protein